MRKNTFFALISRMKYITRWGLMRNTVRENLSEHSFETAVIAHALAVIGQTYFGRDIDAAQIAAAALFHDATEILTGDLPTPVKHGNAALQSAYRAIEHEARDTLLHMLPAEMAPAYRVLFEFDVTKPAFYAYIKAADKISAYLKCVEERKSGNAEFLQAESQLLAAIHALELPEAGYYMTHFADAGGLTLDELS